MKRIVAFGDSWTAGAALPDPMIPHPRAWPALVAAALRRSCVNLAHNGASNTRILWMLRAADLQPDDIVLVQWSFPDRDVILRDVPYDIGPWLTNEPFWREFYTRCNKKHFARRNEMVLEHADLWLAHKGVNALIVANEPGYGQADMQSFFVDKGSDGVHPGLRTHEAWAMHILSMITAATTPPCPPL